MGRKGDLDKGVKEGGNKEKKDIWTYLSLSTLKSRNWTFLQDFVFSSDVQNIFVPPKKLTEFWN